MCYEKIHIAQALIVTYRSRSDWLVGNTMATNTTNSSFKFGRSSVCFRWKLACLFFYASNTFWKNLWSPLFQLPGSAVQWTRRRTHVMISTSSLVVPGSVRMSYQRTRARTGPSQNSGIMLTSLWKVSIKLKCYISCDCFITQALRVLHMVPSLYNIHPQSVLHMLHVLYNISIQSVLQYYMCYI